MKKLTLIIGILILTESCVFTRMDDSIDLGKKYRFVQDFPQTIIYHKTEKYDGVGLEAVLPIVLSYNFNENYIIAKNKDLENGKINYWIIDKRQDYIELKPLDSLTFYETLTINEIDLKLNKN